MSEWRDLGLVGWGASTILMRLHHLQSIAGGPRHEGGSPGPWLTELICLLTSPDVPFVGDGKCSSVTHHTFGLAYTP